MHGLIGEDLSTPLFRENPKSYRDDQFEHDLSFGINQSSMDIVVGDKAVSMRKIKWHSIRVEYLRMTVFARSCTERERERGTKDFLFNRRNNTTPNLTKRLQGHYI